MVYMPGCAHYKHDRTPLTVLTAISYVSRSKIAEIYIPVFEAKDIHVFTFDKYNGGYKKVLCPDDVTLNTDSCTSLEKDSDNDGIIDDDDLCPGTPSGVEVDDNGCPYNNEVITIPGRIKAENYSNAKYGVTKYWNEDRPIFPLLVDMSRDGRLRNLILSCCDTVEEIKNELKKFNNFE